MVQLLGIQAPAISSLSPQKGNLEDHFSYCPVGRQSQLEIHLRCNPGAAPGPRCPRVWVKTYNHIGEILRFLPSQKIRDGMRRWVWF